LRRNQNNKTLVARFSLFHCLTGSIGFILLIRLLLSGSGIEGELFRYLLPGLLGGILGTLYTSFRYRLTQQKQKYLLASASLDKKSITNSCLNTTLRSLHSSNELILDSIGEGVYGVDHDGKTLFINRAVLSFTGFNETQLLAKDQHELLHHTQNNGKPYPADTCPVYKTRQDGKIRKVIGEIFWRKDGSSFPVEYIVTPTNEVNGTFGAVVIFRDISNRVLIEEHLEKSEEQFRTLFDTSTDAILLMDRSGRISNANPAAYRLLYCQNDKQLLGKSLIDFSPLSQQDLSSQETLHKMLHDSLKHGSSFSEWKLEREDLKELDVAVLLARMDLGETIFIQANIRDISDQKKYEQQLQLAKHELEQRVVERTASLQLANRELQEEIAERQVATEAAEQASRTRSYFLSTISNKVQPPLESIISICNTVPLQELSGSQRDNLQNLHLYGERLQWLLTDILNFSQLESKKLTLVYTAFNLRESIEEIVKEFTLRAADKDITLVSDIQQKVPELLIGDSRRLQIILGKLLDNSLKHTRQGDVSVTVKLREQLDDKRITLSFSVVDTGIGISKPDQKYIFDAFSKDFELKEPSSPGSGIGLSLCQKLVSLMGGRIGMESVQGKGSHFWFDITFATAGKSKASSSTENATNTDLLGLNILLADDEFINRRMLSSILEKKGAVVYFAEDGNKAIDVYKTKQIDCILMDVQMPDCNGFEAMETIRSFEESSQQNRTPTIALTAHALQGYQQLCLEAGMDAYITKPVDANLLTENILELLQ